MRIAIAPDKFKGSLSAPEVAAALARGLRSVDASLEIDEIAIADGGEGTLAAAEAAGYRLQDVSVTGPTGQELEASFALRGTQAVIEMAVASGLDALPGGIREALKATSRGTGELIHAALEAGCTEIVLAVGGSATTDGGAGMLAALGARILDADGALVPDGGGSLVDVASVDFSGMDARLTAVQVTLANDVDNPLLGANGAAAIFAPQKGASADDVQTLETGLRRFADAVRAALGTDARDTPGAGAAGGMGYAALTVLNAERRAGVEVVLELVRFDERIRGTHLVITGEGSLDEQSLGGKSPLGVAQAATALGIPVIAVCGRSTLTPEQGIAAGFRAIHALADDEPDITVSMRDAAVLLERIGARIAQEDTLTQYTNERPAR